MISRIWNVVLTLLLIVAASLAIAFAGVRLVGLTPFAVLSGSMEPQYPVGSLIYVKDADPATVQVGQAITFEDGADRLVTHQVYDIDSEQRLFYTQGIANVNDSGEIMHDAAPASWDALVGVPVACIPYLGYVNDWITHAPGIYVMVALVAVIMAVSIAMELHRMSVEKRRAVELERYRQDMQRRSGAYAGCAQGRNPAAPHAAHAVPNYAPNPGARGVPYGAASQNAYGAQPYGVASPAGVTTARPRPRFLARRRARRCPLWSPWRRGAPCAAGRLPRRARHGCAAFPVRPTLRPAIRGRVCARRSRCQQACGACASRKRRAPIRPTTINLQGLSGFLTKRHPSNAMLTKGCLYKQQGKERTWTPRKTRERKGRR